MDREIIDSRIVYIQEKLENIKEYITDYENTADKKQKKILQSALERNTEEVIESAITINQTLLQYKNKISVSYYDSFTDLNCFNIIEEEFLEELASTAGFRNRLAHDYMNLDNKITIKSIKKVIKLYPEYLNHIKDIVDKIEEDNNKNSKN